MLNKYHKEKNKNSIVMRHAVKLLKDTISDIKSGKCTETELIEALVKFNPETNGYFKEEDFVNYDKAGEILHLGWNRNRLKELCDKYHIENKKINNMNVGFLRKEVLQLKEILLEKQLKTRI